MNEKTAIVLDTNFIISYISKISDVHKKLSEKYDVFVSDISIQERLSQKYLELKAEYEKIEKFSTEYNSFVEINIKFSFEDCFERTKESILNSYQELFGNNIIEFIQNTDTLNKLLDRVFKKIPPFNKAEKASDKGFKDTLLWFSFLEYFHSNSGDNVIFVSDDKAFMNNSDALCKEFNEYTGKNIEIRENNFYKEFIKENENFNEENEITVSIQLPDVTLLREKIHETILALCLVEIENSWNELELHYTFRLRTQVTADDMCIVFSNLRKVIERNIFELDLIASEVFALYNIENKYRIPMNALQNALNLYEDFCKKYKDFLPQFFSAAANIFNRSFIEVKSSSDESLPF